LKFDLKKTFNSMVKILLLISISICLSCELDMMGGDSIYNESNSTNESNSNSTTSSDSNSNAGSDSGNGSNTVNDSIVDDGSDSGSGPEITVSKVKNLVEQVGATATNVQVVHQDGLDQPSSLMDIDTVIIAQANGGGFNDDLVFSYDGIYREAIRFSDLNSSLYIDTDVDPETGYLIEDIGADIRISNLGANLSAAKFVYFALDDKWVPSDSGNTSATIMVSEVGEFVNVTVIVTSTKYLSPEEELDAVLVLEEIDRDENTILNRIGFTLPFVIPNQ
jgi:hypothetical protein